VSYILNRICATMAPPPGRLEFNEITLIYRNESKGGEPTEVRKDLYPAFREYLKRLKSEGEDEVRNDPTSMKASSMMSEIKKVTQKGSSIFQYRMSKIMNMALRAGMGSKVDTARLTPEEKDFFEAVVEEVVSCKSLALEGEKLSTKHSGPVSPCTVPVRERLEGGSNEMPATSLQDARSCDKLDGEGKEGSPLVLIRVLEDIPPFSSARRQYRLLREDVVYMPATYACVLVKNGKAVEITVPPA
jgi:DNA replication initiation complex subunit (GINS family)